MASTLELEREQEFSVLLVDDDQDWLAETVDFLQGGGLDRVDTAQTREEADSRLKRKRYDAVLADVELRPASIKGRSPERGDDWLLASTSSIPDTAIKAAVTADPTRIRDYGALEDNGIRIAVKSLESEKILFEEILSEATKRRSRIEFRRKLGEEVLQESADVFLEWLRSRNDVTSHDIWLGSRNLSLQDIAEEVASQTEIGQKLLGMFIAHIRLRIGLNKSLPSGDLG